MAIDIEVLIHDHKRAISTVDGIEIHTQPGLLQQLREAIHGWVGTEGAGGGHRSKLPLQAAALDLYTLIDQQITEAWVAAFKRVPGVEHPETLLAQWAAWASDDQIVEVTRKETRHDHTGEHVHTIRIERTAPNLALMWESMIVDYFNPPSQAEIPSPCLVCGERYVHRQVDGETVRFSAMVFIRERGTGATLRAECAACATTWGPDRFRWLAEQFGIDYEAKRKAHEEAELTRKTHDTPEQEQGR